MKDAKSPAHDFAAVIARDMCSGCGACAVAAPGAVRLELSPFGAQRAEILDASSPFLKSAGRVCPFSDESRDESEIAAEVFPNIDDSDDRIGRFSGLYAARLTSPSYLDGSSSGGMTSWVAGRLLETGRVDGVIHVRADENAPELFNYQISRSVAQLTSKRKSAYYSANFSEALLEIRGDGKRYALMSVPCSIRAARLLTEHDEELRSQLAYFLGLVCGHMKTAGFAEALAWQTGVAPDRLAEVDFRLKSPGRASSDYDFGAREQDAIEFQRKPTKSLVGGNWGHTMFQLNACNYCDDILAETADIAFGDAWLPEYKSDDAGTNIVITRRRELDEMLEEAAADGLIYLRSLTADQVAASQAGNYRHRRVGLAVRLQDDIDAGLSVPNKRTRPGRPVTRSRLALIRLRREIAAVSVSSFARAKDTGDLDVFLFAVRPLIRKYRRLDSGSLPRRVVDRILREIRLRAPFGVVQFWRRR